MHSIDDFKNAKRILRAGEVVKVVKVMKLHPQIYIRLRFHLRTRTKKNSNQKPTVKLFFCKERNIVQGMLSWSYHASLESTHVYFKKTRASKLKRLALQCWSCRDELRHRELTMKIGGDFASLLLVCMYSKCP